MKTTKKTVSVKDLCLVGMLAALSYVCFTFIQFKISLPGGDATSIHLGNMVPVLGALLFGGLYGGIGGAIGMAIGDLFDPIYVVYAPKTLLLKFCIGVITGVVAHGIFHLNRREDKAKWAVPATVAALSGMVFNSVFDPLVGYYYKLLILGKPAAELTLAWNIAACVINAVISTAAAVLLYMALRPALEKSGLLRK
ncbi:MAG: ECF transporter S component [Oscillospiraceae bacterium]|nr:ECF transporter S component [Oscillospiraceae bacterium]